MCTFGVESTIVDLRTPDSPRLLRHGPITLEQIASSLGVTVTDATAATDDKQSQSAPGLLTQHYSPRARVRLYPHGRCVYAGTHELEAVVLNRKPSSPTGTSNTFWLSENGDNASIAQQLFNLLQKLDRKGFRTIHVELSNGQGIGKAINDRLTRAAAK